jgi:serine phosphatase RsbU (regulator of sigma subunit)
MYTDGLMDAMNFQQERFGKQRIIEAFAEGGPNAQTISDNILWSLRRFTGLAKPTDDVTMIVAKVN